LGKIEKAQRAHPTSGAARAGRGAPEDWLGGQREAGILFDDFEQVLFAIEQRARHRQIERVATIANARGGQIGPEARGDGARQHALVFSKCDDAAVRRLVALHDPAGDFRVGHLVEMGAEIRRGVVFSRNLAQVIGFEHRPDRRSGWGLAS